MSDTKYLYVAVLVLGVSLIIFKIDMVVTVLACTTAGAVIYASTHIQEEERGYVHPKMSLIDKVIRNDYFELFNEAPSELLNIEFARVQHNGTTILHHPTPNRVTAEFLFQKIGGGFRVDRFDCLFSKNDGWVTCGYNEDVQNSIDTRMVTRTGYVKPGAIFEVLKELQELKLETSESSTVGGNPIPFLKDLGSV